MRTRLIIRYNLNNDTIQYFNMTLFNTVIFVYFYQVTCQSCCRFSSQSGSRRNRKKTLTQTLLFCSQNGSRRNRKITLTQTLSFCSQSGSRWNCKKAPTQTLLFLDRRVVRNVVLFHNIAQMARKRAQLPLAVRQVRQPAAEVAQESRDQHFGCGAEVRAPTQVP